MTFDPEFANWAKTEEKRIAQINPQGAKLKEIMTLYEKCWQAAQEDQRKKNTDIQMLITVISKSYKDRLKWLYDQGIICSNSAEYDEDFWNVIAKAVAKQIEEQ